tara:strand:+ start:22 stop:366 length:345 start_codon:yes stop_codon:yes gene_type:complete
MSEGCNSKSNVDTKFAITLGIGLAVQAAGIVWFIANLNSSVQHNSYRIEMLQREVRTDIETIHKEMAENSRFRTEWPQGVYLSGELPSDTKQNLKIEMLEKSVESIQAKIDRTN